MPPLLVPCAQGVAMGLYHAEVERLPEDEAAGRV
ncbi:hypothetical protein Pla175_29520 [Pirellulimonas nuda]|uniref:Uncharacterized protein n=1 Tax=Pirellulimonas nuda TaxID=2528009 RepID=A0A518DDK9_9BACT|nr:hypothetical protein Pla175_29520 [Pirellulimonas nuda]